MTKLFLKKLHSKFHLRAVSSGPGTMHLFGTNTVRAADYTVETDADNKLGALLGYCFTCERRNQVGEPLNPTEKKVLYQAEVREPGLEQQHCRFVPSTHPIHSRKVQIRSCRIL